MDFSFLIASLLQSLHILDAIQKAIWQIWNTMIRSVSRKSAIQRVTFWVWCRKEFLRMVMNKLFGTFRSSHHIKKDINYFHFCVFKETSSFLWSKYLDKTFSDCWSNEISSTNHLRFFVCYFKNWLRLSYRWL